MTQTDRSGAATQDVDDHFMRKALDLAAKGRGRVEPNPMVGCLIVRDRQVLAEGFHQQFGGPHAEIDALQKLGPGEAAGATAYVTLEPCCHHGKTPPCSDALIRAGLGRVVVAMKDPFPQVDGGGLKQIQQAGIEITVGVLRAEAEDLNAPYLKRLRCGVPWVIAKWAMTADGRIATVGGESQWITGASSRSAVHDLRRRVDAIAVGMGTVQADDPRLTARPAGGRTLTRVVFCRNRLPDPTSKLMTTADSAPVLLVTTMESTEKMPEGVEVICLPGHTPTQMVTELLKELGNRTMTNVMVEGGGELLASFLEAGQIDEFHVYVGAKIFSGRRAPGPIMGSGIVKLADTVALDLIEVDRFEDDLRVVYRKKTLPSRNHA